MTAERQLTSPFNFLILPFILNKNSLISVLLVRMTQNYKRTRMIALMLKLKLAAKCIHRDVEDTFFIKMFNLEFEIENE